MNAYKARLAKKEEAAPPPPPEDVLLLREIRDLLKSGGKSAPADTDKPIVWRSRATSVGAA